MKKEDQEDLPTLNSLTQLTLQRLLQSSMDQISMDAL
jgi:hypothetical protein